MELDVFVFFVFAFVRLEVTGLGAAGLEVALLLLLPLSFYLLDVGVLVNFQLDHVALPVVHLEHGVFESVPASHLEHHSVFLGNLGEKAALYLLLLFVFNDDVQEFIDFVRFSNNFGDDAP